MQWRLGSDRGCGIETGTVGAAGGADHPLAETSGGGCGGGGGGGGGGEGGGWGGRVSRAQLPDQSGTATPASRRDPAQSPQTPVSPSVGTPTGGRPAVTAHLTETETETETETGGEGAG